MLILEIKDICQAFFKDHFYIESTEFLLKKMPNFQFDKMKETAIECIIIHSPTSDF